MQQEAASCTAHPRVRDNGRCVNTSIPTDLLTCNSHKLGITGTGAKAALAFYSIYIKNEEFEYNLIIL
jgi:hypothetical protein